MSVSRSFLLSWPDLLKKSLLIRMSKYCGINVNIQCVSFHLFTPFFFLDTFSTLISWCSSAQQILCLILFRENISIFFGSIGGDVVWGWSHCFPSSTSPLDISPIIIPTSRSNWYCQFLDLLGISYLSAFPWTSLISQLVKNLPAMQETPVRFLGRNDPPGEGIGYPLQYPWASLISWVC